MTASRDRGAAPRTVCPACGAEIPEPPRCPRCSAEVAPDGLVCLRGTLGAAPEPPRDRSGWYRGPTLRLADGRELPLEVSDQQTRQLVWPGADEAALARAGTRLVAFGELRAVFGEEHAGLREAPERSLRLLARLVARGPGADRLIDRGIARHYGEPAEAPADAALRRIPEGLEVRREGTTTLLRLPGPDVDERAARLPLLVLPALAAVLLSQCYGNDVAGAHAPLAAGQLILVALLIYALVVLLCRRPEIGVSPGQLFVRIRPLPWFGGWRATTDAIARVEGGEVLLPDARRSLLPDALSLDDRHRPFVAAALNATLHGEGQRVPLGGDLARPAGLRFVLVLALVFTLFAGALAVHGALPARAWIWHGVVLRAAIDRAARCDAVTRQLGAALTWGAGNPGGRSERRDDPHFRINLVGSKGRAQLFVRYRDEGDHYQLLEARVERFKSAGRPHVDLLRCPPRPRSDRSRSGAPARCSAGGQRGVTSTSPG